MPQTEKRADEDPDDLKSLFAELRKLRAEGFGGRIEVVFSPKQPIDIVHLHQVLRLNAQVADEVRRGGREL